MENMLRVPVAGTQVNGVASSGYPIRSNDEEIFWMKSHTAFISE